MLSFMYIRKNKLYQSQIETFSPSEHFKHCFIVMWCLFIVILDKKKSVHIQYDPTGHRDIVYQYQIFIKTICRNNCVSKIKCYFAIYHSKNTLIHRENQTNKVLEIIMITLTCHMYYKY